MRKLSLSELIMLDVLIIFIILLFSVGCETTTGDTALAVGTVYATASGHGVEAAIVNELVDVIEGE